MGLGVFLTQVKFQHRQNKTWWPALGGACSVSLASSPVLVKNLIWQFRPFFLSRYSVICVMLSSLTSDDDDDHRYSMCGLFCLFFFSVTVCTVFYFILILIHFFFNE